MPGHRCVGFRGGVSSNSHRRALKATQSSHIRERACAYWFEIQQREGERVSRAEGPVFVKDCATIGQEGFVRAQEDISHPSNPPMLQHSSLGPRRGLCLADQPSH